MSDRFASLLVDQLILQGVDHFCISPGSRSTPLVCAIAENKKAHSLVHFDERGMAFYALGLAKGLNKPVAIITTSGSAIANLYPAVMEAFYDRVPLILLTADRPPELQDCGANQTCDQNIFFSTYVHWFHQITCAEDSISNNYIASTVAQAVYRSMSRPPGPVHLNCCFREPFFENTAIPFNSPCFYEKTTAALSQETLKRWAQLFNQASKGVIIAASASSNYNQALIKLSKQLKWPILSDVLSGMRGSGSHSTIIPYYNTLLKNDKNLQPDIVLQFGDNLVSKSLQEWLVKVNPSKYVAVIDHPYRSDPHHRLTDRIECCPNYFCESLPPLISKSSTWLDRWTETSSLIEEQLNRLVEPLSEPGIIHFLSKHLPSKWGLFLANSMPVRDAESFLFPLDFSGPIIGKRGVSGIEGCIATAAGLTQGIKGPLFAILGDMSVLHDLNSLALLQKTPYPIIIFVINNEGGGIFSFLPIAKKKPKIFEEFVATQHSYTFQSAADMFNIPYIKLQDIEVLTHAIKTEKTCFIELKTNRAENAALHSAIDKSLSLLFSTDS
jgi:2-succinyl-5-enolpyruvyl-6-hydroxy-3-cyclohexene-1-carboxylate synthase